LLDDDQIVAGFAVVCVLRSFRARLYEYLAVDPNRRKTGMGAALTRYVLRKAAAINMPGVVLEVESPDDAETSTEREESARRIAFHERTGGAVLLPVSDYRIPMPNAPELVPLSLMWMPAAAPELPTGQTLSMWFAPSFGSLPDARTSSGSRAGIRTAEFDR